jgi:hypothetical protein
VILRAVQLLISSQNRVTLAEKLRCITDWIDMPLETRPQLILGSFAAAICLLDLIRSLSLRAILRSSRTLGWPVVKTCECKSNKHPVSILLTKTNVGRQLSSRLIALPETCIPRWPSAISPISWISYLLVIMGWRIPLMLGGSTSRILSASKVW